MKHLNEVEAVRAAATVEQERDRYRAALERIVACPNPDSVEGCHDLMWDIAKEALDVN